MGASPSGRSRCDFLLSWPFLVSLALLLLNDLYLKPYRPSWPSGILSDAAGMVFFPLLLVAAAELAMLLSRSHRLAKPWWFAVASIVVASAFVLAKFTPWGESAYSWLVAPVLSLSDSSLNLGTYGVVSDPIDLLALLLAPAAYLVGRGWREVQGM